METFNKRMIRLFLNHPLDYKTYLSMYDNPRYALRVISNLIPTDTGIEFEIGELFVKSIRHIKSNGYFPNVVMENNEEVTFRLRKDHFNRDLNELNQFYNYLRKGYNKGNRFEGSGIHIHTNLIKGKLSSDSLRFLIRNATLPVTYIADHFKYTGDYNERKFSTVKGNCVIYRHSYGTLEYRCIKMTWDFVELLKYIIYCHKCTSYFYESTLDKSRSKLYNNIKNLDNLLDWK